MTTSLTPLGLAVLVLTALLGCGSADDTEDHADATDVATTSAPSDSVGMGETTSDGFEFHDLTSPADMGLEMCWTDFCEPRLLGDCGDPELCENDGYECSLSHGDASGDSGLRCALGSELRSGEHETCETLDATGLQTCEKGAACIGPAGDDFGSCHRWCGSDCNNPDDVCLRFMFPEVPIGGYCVRSCNPLDAAPCPHTGQSLCADLYGQGAVWPPPGGGMTQSYFACVPSKPGPVVERGECDVTRQHNAFGNSVPDAACAPGLTCANYRFADQTFRRLQCLRVCDAPEDCDPTEICVSNAEYTEAVGAPIGVCEAM